MGIFKKLSGKHRSSMRRASGGGGGGGRVVRSEAGARRYGVPVGTPISAAKAKQAGNAKPGGAGLPKGSEYSVRKGANGHEVVRNGEVVAKARSAREANELAKMGHDQVSKAKRVKQDREYAVRKGANGYEVTRNGEVVANTRTKSEAHQAASIGRDNSARIDSRQKANRDADVNNAAGATRPTGTSRRESMARRAQQSGTADAARRNIRRRAR